MCVEKIRHGQNRYFAKLRNSFETTPYFAEKMVGVFVEGLVVVLPSVGFKGRKSGWISFAFLGMND